MRGGRRVSYLKTELSIILDLFIEDVTDYLLDLAEKHRLRKEGALGFPPLRRFLMQRFISLPTIHVCPAGS